MEKPSRNLLIILGVVLFSACLCIGLVSVISGGLLLWTRTVSSEVITPTQSPVVILDQLPTNEPPTKITTPTSNAPITPTPNVVPTSQPTEPVPEVELPADVANQMDEIQEQVITLRGLEPEGSVTRALLTPEQLRQHIINNFLTEYTAEEAREDVLILSTFGLLNSDFDLHTLYLELYSEQIAGFYDDETKELYVILDNDFDGAERLFYAHEATHAIQDQIYDMQNGLNYNDDACEKDTERCAAILALLEGDASLAEVEWLTTYASPQDFLDIMSFNNDYESPVYDNAPAFLQQDFLFPYTYGMSYVESLHNAGGWEKVDQAYTNPPISTEQILHPERYPDDIPMTIDLPDLTPILGEGWHEIDRNVLGEWYTYLVLAHGLDPNGRLEDSQAKEAAEGWGGDSYLVYYNEATGGLAMILKMVWESAQEVSEFSTAFVDYANHRFGEPVDETSQRMTWEYENGLVGFQSDGLTTIWIMTPDETTAQAIWEHFQ